MAQRPRLLLVEDDDAIVDVLVLGFSYEGFEVDVARTGIEAFGAFQHGRHDLILLDLMLPEVDGLTTLSRIRKTSSVPVIVITARDALADRVGGLQGGADDYVTKPFEFPELVARVNAVLRRRDQAPTEERIEIEDLVIDRPGRVVRRGGRVIDLTARQFDLLVALASHSGRVMSKQQLYEAAWGWEYYENPNVVEQHISLLRKSLDQPFDTPLIQTVRGVGYVFRPEGG